MWPEIYTFWGNTLNRYVCTYMATNDIFNMMREQAKGGLKFLSEVTSVCACVSWCHFDSRKMTTTRFEEVLKVQRWKMQDIHYNTGLVAMPALNPINESVQSISPQITPMTQPLILNFPNHISFFRSLHATHSNSYLSTYPSKITASKEQRG